MKLVFREEDHSFWLGDRRLPSVTQILKHFIPRFERDEWYLLRGTAVHKATELYDKGTLDPDSVDPQIEGYLQGWIKFRMGYDFVPGQIEYQAHDPIYLYAGIVDRTGSCKIGDCFLDIKSGAPSNTDLLQLAGYSRFIKEPAGFNVYLHEDGTYKIKQYNRREMKEAANIFLSMTSIYNYLTREGIITWQN